MSHFESLTPLSVMLTHVTSRVGPTGLQTIQLPSAGVPMAPAAAAAAARHDAHPRLPPHVTTASRLLHINEHLLQLPPLLLMLMLLLLLPARHAESLTL